MSKDENQLFVGRLPRGSRSSELEDVFYKYGKMTRCDVKQGGELCRRHFVYSFFEVFFFSFPSLTGIKMGE